MAVAYRIHAVASVVVLLASVSTALVLLPSSNYYGGGYTKHLRCRGRECALTLITRASSTDEMDTDNVDNDLDDFMKEMFEASATAAYSRDNAESMKELFQTSAASDDNSINKKNETGAAAENLDSSKTREIPSHFIQREKAVGIGGNDGFVFDVNKLKRNLVQESVRGCKQELLVLLGDGRQVVDSKKDGKQKNNITVPKWKKDRDDLIEERLASLVQNNPVSTTTDSNLLDGDWAFAFQTNSAKTILDTSRFLLSKAKRVNTNNNDSGRDGTITTVRGGPWRFRYGKTENPFRSSTRQVFLENLSNDDNAHIVDRTSMFGGLFKISRRYEVYGLTRTSIDLDLMNSESRFIGMPVNRKDRDDFLGTKYGSPLEIQVLYLDGDLCVCTTGQGLDGPVHVYTKSNLWATSGAKRNMRLLLSWFFSLQSPLRVRQRLSNAFEKVNKKSLNIDGSDLQAINIGEIDITDDGLTAEEPAWDGDDDPFYHLTPGERMDVLRTMSLSDIYKSAVNRKEQNQKQKRRFGGSRKGSFKRPDS